MMKELEVYTNEVANSTRKIFSKLYDENVKSIPMREAHTMLRSLGFIMRNNGPHVQWRHRKGESWMHPHNPEKDLTGYLLKSLRETLHIPEFRARAESGELPTLSIVVSDTPKPTLQEKLQEKAKVENHARQDKEVIQRLKQLETFAIAAENTLKSVQELLLELAAKVDSLPTLIPQSVQKPTPAKSPKYLAIEKAIADNPQFKENPQVIAALAGDNN